MTLLIVAVAVAVEHLQRDQAGVRRDAPAFWPFES